MSMSDWTNDGFCNRSLTNHRDIQVLKTYGAAPYAAALKRLEKEIKEKQTSVNEKIGLFTEYASAQQLSR